MKTLVEELSSADQQHKVQICKREDGRLQVVLWRWCREVVPEHGVDESYWDEVKERVTLTDSLDRARTLALELLNLHAKPE